MKRLAVLSLMILGPMILVPMTARGDDKVDFMEQIQPIFKRNCYKCHGPSPNADKGDFRMHSKEAFVDAEIVMAGSVDESELFARIALDAEEDGFMPKGGKPLSEEQIELIRVWIDSGAEMPDGLHIDDPASKVPDVPAAPEAAVAAIAETGALVMPLAQNDNRLTIGFGSNADGVGDAELSLLPPVAEQLVWLNLARTKVTDEGLATLSELPNLTRLHLELTGITDAGLAHIAGLKQLEYLNLYGTEITDAGLAHLEGLSNLKRLYLWQTKVSYDPAMALQEKIEGLEVNLGHDHPGVVRRRLDRQLELATKRKEEAAAQEEQARQEKEAAAKLEEEARQGLAELDKAEGKTVETPAAEGDAKAEGEQETVKADGEQKAEAEKKDEDQKEEAKPKEEEKKDS